MPATYAYQGTRTVYYFKFRDLQSGHTLVADPGGIYQIASTEPDISVPPGDGLWAPVFPDPAPPAPALAPAPALTLPPSFTPLPSLAPATEVEEPADEEPEEDSVDDKKSAKK